MTTYASQNMGAHDLKRVDRGVNTALGIGCVYSVASFLILRVLDVPLISLFLESSEVEIMANARSFIFWNSVFYIPLLSSSSTATPFRPGLFRLAMFAGVAEMVARAMVGFWFVPLWGYFAACIASPVAWFFACFFLIPAYFVVRKTPAEGKGRREGTRCPHRKRLKNVRKLSCKGELFCCSGCRAALVSGNFIRCYCGSVI